MVRRYGSGLYSTAWTFHEKEERVCPKSCGPRYYLLFSTLAGYNGLRWSSPPRTCLRPNLPCTVLSFAKTWLYTHFDYWSTGTKGSSFQFLSLTAGLLVHTSIQCPVQSSRSLVHPGPRTIIASWQVLAHLKPCFRPQRKKRQRCSPMDTRYSIHSVFRPSLFSSQ